ncbi:hypothetical protein DFJ74DRAFT_672432 [Hyaloraphidium curvatum]|nr:hypothetical protein DFJ74DRAFT_672432 [Hyaloraphidium curvatum]
MPPRNMGSRTRPRPAAAEGAVARPARTTAAGPPAGPRHRSRRRPPPPLPAGPHGALAVGGHAAAEGAAAPPNAPRVTRTDCATTSASTARASPAGRAAGAPALLSALLVSLLAALLAAAPAAAMALWPQEVPVLASNSSDAASPRSLAAPDENLAEPLTGFVNPLEKCQNVRWDADFSHNPEPGMPPRYVPVCADLTPAEARRLERARRLEDRQTQQPFSIRFTCTDTTNAVCEKAKTGFEKAGQRLAQALKIDRTIVVQATFKSFCQGQGSSCSLRNTLGQAAASSYLQGRFGDDGPWLFPQSLFKQISNGAAVQLKDVDIIAEFNTDFNFWFPGDNQITFNQVDFELVVAHEFTHGLGLTSGWNTWFSSVYPILPSQDFLTPSIFIQSPVGDASPNNYFFAGWQQLQILDKYIYAVGSGKSLVDSAKTITSFTGSSGTRLSSWITQFQQSGAPYAEAKSVYSIATSGYRQLEFRIPTNAASQGGTIVYLQTVPGRWLPGSSIAHVDLQDEGTGPDFLMIPDVTSLTGRTLDNILATQAPGWKYGAIGPQLAGMLSAMGWPTLIAAGDSNAPVGNGTGNGTSTTTRPPRPTSSPTSFTPVAPVPVGSAQPSTIGPFTIPQFVGVVVGSVAAAAAIAAGAIWLARRGKKKEGQANGHANGNGYPNGNGYSGDYPYSGSGDYPLAAYPAAPPPAVQPAPRNAVAPAYYPGEIPAGAAVYAYTPGSGAYPVSNGVPTYPAAAAAYAAPAAPPAPYRAASNDPYLASTTTNAATRNARGVYAVAAGTALSPQEASDLEYAKALQEQEEALAGVRLAHVATPPPIVPARPAPAPPLPARRTATSFAAPAVPESDYELARRLQAEEDARVAAAPSTPPRPSPRPAPAGPRPLPQSSSFSSDVGIETPTYGSVQDRIRMLNASTTGTGGSRPAGSYLDQQ